MSNKAGVKKVKGAETAGLVPRLRFPEFRGAGEWKEERIGDVLDYTRPEAYIVSSTKYENEGIPVLTANKSFVLGYTTEDWGIFQDVPVIIFDDFTVDRKYVDFPFKVKSSAIKILKARGKNRIRFIFESMNQIRFDAAEHKRHYISTYRELIVRMPEAREQQRIADCLSSLDEVITLEAKRLEALKVHKKGLMQQLFPAEGETVPKLRFPEFRGAGEWEEKPLGSVCEVLNNRRKPVSSSGREKGEYPYYGASGIVDYVRDYIFDERLLLVGEDGAKWGPFEKTAFIADGKYWVNNHAHVLRPIDASDTLLENYLTMVDIGPYVTGAAPPKLTLGKLKGINVCLPPLMEEQQKIADCLSSLDEAITLESKKLDALKVHKKGLMQQLFPSSEV